MKRKKIIKVMWVVVSIIVIISMLALGFLPMF